MESLRQLFARLPSPALGAWAKLPSEESCEILSQSGFDYIVIDLEHSQLSMDTAFRLITITSLAGLPALVRLPDLNPFNYQRILDAGASAILAPQLESVLEIEMGLSFCRYPPLGRRGFSTTTRAGGWGARRMNEHVTRSNSEISFIPQLESRAALEAIGDISGIDGLDAVFIGQADLSVSSGFSRDSPVMGQLVGDAISQCHSRQVLVGTAISDVASVATGSCDGFDFVLIGDDASMLANAARRAVVDVRTAFSARGGSDGARNAARSREALKEGQT